ncbi:MAG: biotin/lipoyl-binding protein [Gammaproteobacteria bacterium]|nr:biotin/lipoyl-binding protein [Gammaproteobacteria bacterium]
MKLKITLDGVTYEVDVEFVDEESGAAPTPAPSKPAPTSTPQLKTAAAKPAGAVPSGGDVTCPLSGTVFKILVKVGERVDTGQDLIVLEAMKMETNIVAAVPGVVKNIPVAEGDAVSQGQLLIEFE